jgi:hypothetical protein
MACSPFPNTSTSAYVSIRQHTSANVRIRQHTFPNTSKALALSALYTCVLVLLYVRYVCAQTSKALVLEARYMWPRATICGVSLCALCAQTSVRVRFSISKAEHESIEQLEVRPQLDAHVTYADVC